MDKEKDKTKITETANPKTINAIKQIKFHKKLKQNLAQPHYMSPIKKVALSKIKTKQTNSSKDNPSSSPQLLRSITPNMKRNRDVINCNNTKKVMNTTNSNYKSRSLTPIRGVSSNANGKLNNVDNGMSGLKNNHKELAIILALKKKIRAMSEMMEKKDKEIAKLKVGQSKARINELEIENKVLNNEMKKMKEIFEKKGMSDYKEIGEQVQKDKEEIKQLQEHLKIIGEKYQNEMIKSKKSEESYLNLNQDYTALREENEKIKKENEQLKEKSQKDNEYDKEYASLQEEKVKELNEQINKLNSLLEQVTKEKEDLIAQNNSDKEIIEKLQKEKEEIKVNGSNNEEIEKLTKEKEELEAISKSNKEMIAQLNKEKENLIEVSNTDKQIISSYQNNLTTLLSIPLLDDFYIKAISMILQHQHKTLNIEADSIKEITQKDKDFKSIADSLCDIYHIDKTSISYFERYLIHLIKTTDNISIETLSDKLLSIVTEEKQSSSDIPEEINVNIKTLFEHLTLIDCQSTKEISIDILYSLISSLYSDNKEIALTSILNFILSNSNLPQLPLLSYNYQCLSNLIKQEEASFIPRNDTNLVITDAKEPHLLVEESEKKSTIFNGIEEQEKTSQHEEPPISFNEMFNILKSHIESTKTSIESILSVFTDEDFTTNENNVKLLPISTYQSKMILLSGHNISSDSFDEKILDDSKENINIPLFISLFDVNENELINVNQATKEYVDEVFNEVISLNKNKQ